MKKVVILYNINRKSNEFEAEFDSPKTISFLKNCMTDLYHVETLEADKNFKWIKKIQQINPDVVFNVSEGFYGPARESVYTAILDQIGLRYCGPDSTNLLMCLNKHLCKELITSNNYSIKAPKHIIIKKDSDINKLNEIDFFPVFIKLNSEGSSIGIDKKSINNRESLRPYVMKLWRKYEKRPVLIEEYIQGYDVSMSYVEGMGVFGPVKVEYQNSLSYDYALKTKFDDEVIIKKDENDNKIRNILEANTKTIVKLLDLRGYAKLDFRVKEDKIYFLEVNSQISFHPLGEFLTAFENTDYTKKEVVLQIIKNSLSKRLFSVGYDKGEI